MSLVARSLLVLAFASLLHAWEGVSDYEDRLRTIYPDWTSRSTMGHLQQGIVNDKNSKLRKIPPFDVTPRNQTNFIFNLPNLAHRNEALIGQNVDVASPDAHLITLKPLHHNKHSPIQVHCVPRCKHLYVVADQYVIPTLG